MHALTLHVALALVTGTVAVAPTSNPEADAAFERGRRLYELGSDLPGARAALDEAIRLRPDHADAYLYRALVTAHDHGVAAARADFEFALKLRPDHAETHRHFAEALADAGEHEAAERHYRRALELLPDYADAIYLLGKLLRARGRLDEAVGLLERHAALVPQGTAHHVLGEIFLEKGDLTRAAREFELDLETDPSCHESRLNLAGLHLDRGAYDEAREQYEISLTYHPADARALAGLGRAYLALGDDELAVGTLRQALALSPDDERTRDALAEARARLRLRMGWPFAAVPSAIAAGLLTAILLGRRNRRRARDADDLRRGGGGGTPSPAGDRA